MLTPAQIADRGEKLYTERYQQQYEHSHAGKFLVIDVTTPNGTPYLAETPVAALEAAERANPQGFFHIVKIGAPAVYRVGYTRGTSRGWQL